MCIKNSRGFSLMEMMIVLLILSIIVMIGLPSTGRSSREARLYGAVSEIVSAIDYARVTAMNSGCKVRITIDENDDRILLEQFLPDADLFGSETELSANDVESGSFVTMEHPANHGTDYHIIFSDEERFKAVDITASVFGENDHFIFSPSGTPTSGGSVTITCGDLQAVLNVDSVSGRVTRS